MNATQHRPVVAITGASGDIGRSLMRELGGDYSLVGLDRDVSPEDRCSIEMDLTSKRSIDLAVHQLGRQYGQRIAAVVHLAAYFDFTGEEHPLYRQVNVEGTRYLLRALQSLDVERFAYASTMLVHRPARVGERIDEGAAIEPAWAYPRSKAAAEEVIRQERGSIACVILRLAGLYDERTCVPTLAHQIARIYERDLKSRIHPGEMDAGQAFVHRDDLLSAFRLTIERRQSLPAYGAILIGEPDAMSADDLQDRIGHLIHGEPEWRTIRVPPILAKAGAWLQTKAEPVVPDSIDDGRPPFIRPFMVERAQDNFSLDIACARELLGWVPQHDIRRALAELIANLKADPARWYRDNKISPPAWIETASELDRNAEALRTQYEKRFRGEVRASRWAHLCNLALATWLVTAPFILDYRSQAMVISDVTAGLALTIAALASLSWRGSWARWSSAAIGCWLLCAPIFLWAPQPAAYMNDTLVGMLIVGFAICTRPTPGLSPTAALVGPTVPPGWDASPSSWLQRLPIIVLAFVGLHVSRYLAAYQLGHIDAVWDPFFAGGPDPKNGTEEIITSSVSRAWPVSDAGVGAVTYALEILTGLIGSARRWRTMPWLVVLFGLMIVPLGVVSLTFIIIQPILIGTWCALCLIAAAAMLVQIPYSLDELVATGQFLLRRKRAGKSLLRVFFTGDIDEGGDSRRDSRVEDSAAFDHTLLAVIRESFSGGVSLPWNLVASIVVGVWLMLTRVTIGTEGAMANADHLIGSLAITVAVTALAEVARPVRLINVGFGLVLLATPALLDAGLASTVSSIGCGIALILLSLRRGAVRQQYGGWNRYLV